MQHKTAGLYWLLSILLSALAILVIGYTWQKTNAAKRDVMLADDAEDYSHSHRIQNRADLKVALNGHDTIELSRKKAPLRILTGFFIQSLDFRDANDVNITGYIWQKFPEAANHLLELVKNGNRQVIFPEEVFSSDTQIVKIYEKEVALERKDALSAGTADLAETGGYTVVGWYFDVTVRQQFDYSRYPLDRHAVWLRVWAPDFASSAGIILVPDFDSYRTELTGRFGTDEDFVQGGWEIDETFFNYHNNEYSTNFGIFGDMDNQKYKELYFNIGIRRKFRNAFIINLVPLFIVALLLFAQVMTVTGDADRMEKFGFNTTNAIGTCSALFFVVMLAHIQVRQQFAGSGLVYIEYFYLVQYLFILLTSLNAYVFSLGKLAHINLVHYHDNFIPKVAFWPSLLWMMTLVTVFEFWPA